MAVGELELFLKAVEQEVVPRGSVLLVESLTAYSRDQIVSAQMLFLRIIVDAECTIVTLADRKVYSRESVNANPVDMILSIVLLMRAHEESATKGRRVAAAWGAKRARTTTDGKVLTKWVPGWLKSTGSTGMAGDKGSITIRPERAEIVRGIFRDTLKGVGLDGIAQRLNSEAVEPWGAGGRGKAAYWHRSYISKILDNPAVIGTFVPHTDAHVEGKRVRTPLDPVPNYFPAVIDTDTWERVQQMRRVRKMGPRGRHAAGRLNNLFASLLKCPICGGTMFLHNKGPRPGRPNAWAVCQAAKSKAGCVYKGVPYHKIEGAFREDASYLLAHMPMGESTAKMERELEKMETGIDVERDAIINVLKAIERDPNPTLTTRLRELENDLANSLREAEALAHKITAATPRAVMAKRDALAKALAADPFDRREVNALLRQMVDGIVVDYDAGDLALMWSHGGESRVTYDYGPTFRSAA